MRDQFGNRVALDRGAVATGAEDLDVAATELRGFEDRLAAAAARRADHVATSPDDREARDLVEPERVLRGGQRALLGAQAEPVAGVFHIRAGDDGAFHRFDCAADAELGIRRIGLARGRAGKADKFFVCHALVFRRAHGPCARQSESEIETMKLKFLISAAVAALVCVPAPALAWGKTGHRVVAAIADTQLSGLARAHIREILNGGESLDEAANWPDEMRSDPAPFWQKTSTPWHYVTLDGITYDHAPPQGDALEVLDRFSRTLKDPNASLVDKQLALRFIVHLVGDLHQPLHVGKCCDKGGNDVKVTFFGKPTNLHAAWDSALVDNEQLSFSELAAKLERHTSDQDTIAWWDINPRDWISESAQYRDRLYPTAADKPRAEAGKKSKEPPVPDLSYAYVYKFTPLMEQRLSQAGVRLAAYLNAIYAEPPSLRAEPAR